MHFLNIICICRYYKTMSTAHSLTPGRTIYRTSYKTHVLIAERSIKLSAINFFNFNFFAIFRSAVMSAESFVVDVNPESNLSLSEGFGLLSNLHDANNTQTLSLSDGHRLVNFLNQGVLDETRHTRDSTRLLNELRSRIKAITPTPTTDKVLTTAERRRQCRLHHQMSANNNMATLTATTIAETATAAIPTAVTTIAETTTAAIPTAVTTIAETTTAAIPTAVTTIAETTTAATTTAAKKKGQIAAILDKMTTKSLVLGAGVALVGGALLYRFLKR
jgi:hypothetical protein